MNPCTWVAGGGAGTGGSGAGGGKGGKGKAGAGTNNGSEDPQGGGKGANACGQGTGAGCPNPAHAGSSTAAGDPVDVSTGRVYTFPEFDVALPGPLPLVIQRSYSSDARARNVGLGFGWTHSLAWELVMRRRRAELWMADGVRRDIERPEPGRIVQVADGLEMLVTSELVRLFNRRGEIWELTPESPNAERYVLTRMLDGNGNEILLEYRNGQLERIRDSVGRIVRVRRHSTSLIFAFEIELPGQSTISFMRYEHDANGDLIRVIDALGYKTEFTYEDHRLVRHAQPDGLFVHYRYDARGRCYETWCDYGGRPDPSLADNVPKLLADGFTPAKGVLHCKIEYGDDFTEVVDSCQVRRYDLDEDGNLLKGIWGSAVYSRELTEEGHLARSTNAEGATWSWDYDAFGRPLTETDPLGTSTRYEYENGAVVRASFPDGAFLRYYRDARGNVTSIEDALGIVVSYEYEDRGLLVTATTGDARVTRFEYDAHGNRTAVTEPNGGTRRLGYDYLGHIIQTSDERGFETRYTYDARGYLESLYLPDGAVESRQYDAKGRVVAFSNGDGQTHQLLWAGYNSVHAVVRPDGSEIRYRYDRETRLLEIHNAAGETHRFERDAAGHIVLERTFDGREFHYRCDANGRTTRVERGNGEVTEIVYDPLGRIVERTYDDCTIQTEYDARGRLLIARAGESTTAFEYDKRGRVVREVHSDADGSEAVLSTYDEAGQRVKRETSRGYQEQIRRDALGLPVGLVLDGHKQIALQRDLSSNEVERILPGNGRIVRQRGPTGILVRTVLEEAVPGVPHGPTEPEWIGRSPNTRLDRSSEYSRGGQRLRVSEAGMGTLEYRREPLGRVVTTLLDDKVREQYSYDAADGLHESVARPARRYAAGGRLVAVGSTEYAYDGDGRLVEKRIPGSNGSPEVWQYVWNARGLLQSVLRPDGVNVEFTYDAFARRTRKRVTTASGSGSTTRYVWDGFKLVHQIREIARDSGDPVIEERTFVFIPETHSPIAHSDTMRANGAAATSWQYYLTSASELPEHLLDETGKIVSETRFDHWGRPIGEATPATPLRFQGQIYDEEIGLAYSHHRYYDPEIGRFISPEPLSIEGGLSAYAYVDNRPDILVDTDGLRMRTNVAGRTANGTPVNGTAPSGSQFGGVPRTRDQLHPAVQGAMVPEGTNARPPGQAGTEPHFCSEPNAMSNYLYNYEQTAGLQPGTLQPGHPEWNQAIGSAQITNTERGRTRAPCPNCSQMLSNLGVSSAQITPGGRDADTPPSRNTTFTRPDPAWAAAQPAGTVRGPVRTRLPFT